MKCQKNPWSLLKEYKFQSSRKPSTNNPYRRNCCRRSMVSGKGIGKVETCQDEYEFMTNSEKLAWLNSSKGYAKGMTDMYCGEVTIKVHAVK